MSSPSVVPFLPISEDECLVTSGLETTCLGNNPLAFGGMPTEASPAPPAPASNQQIVTLPESSNPFVNPLWTPDSSYSSGTFNNALQLPGLNQAQSCSDQSDLMNAVNKTQWTADVKHGMTIYTGSDLKVILEVANSGTNPSQIRLSKVLTELTTITVSVHRVKSAAVALGYINPKGFARGRRTIAGTVIFTKFGQDVLADFLSSAAFTSDLSKDSSYVKVDQLPPFNLTFLFMNEYGDTSYQRILGMEFVTSGDVYSIQDMLSEQTVSYVCADFTPMLPLPKSGQLPTDQSNSATNREQTPGDVMSSGKSTASATVYAGPMPTIDTVTSPLNVQIPYEPIQSF